MTTIRRQRLATGILCGLLLGLVPLFANAQAPGTPPSGLPEWPLSAAAPPANTVSCFDYYHFGSVQVRVTTELSRAVSGSPISFRGTIANANSYPIVDGSLYVKVMRARKQNDGNGPDIVDQFFVKDGIAILAGGSIPVSFSWNVPSNAQSGEYMLATFFTVAHAFNLLGLTFTDDVVGNTVPFTVSGEQSYGVQFDKARVTVEGNPYHFAAFAPRVSANKPVTVSARIVNTTPSPTRATIRWQVNRWDAARQQNVVQEDTQSIDVPANSSAPVSLSVADAEYPVYLVVGTLAWQDTKSIINVRFVRDGLDRTPINFPGVASFPLKAGQENTLFSCLHNSGTSGSVPNGRLELDLTDMNGNVIHSYSYVGDVTSAMMGVADAFVPRKTYDRFILDARLYEGDQQVDASQITYDCEQIDAALCTKGGWAPGTMIAIVAALIAMPILALFAMRLRRSRPGV